MKFLVYLFLLIIVLFLNACGGNNSYNSTKIDKGMDRLTKIFSNNVCDTSPLPATPIKEINNINLSNEWKLSSDFAPRFTKLKGKILDFSNIVYPQHPRLYFRNSDINHLKSQRDSKLWRSFRGSLELRFPKGISEEKALNNLTIYEKAWSEYGAMLLLVALLDNDPHYKKIAISWAMHLANDGSGDQYDDTAIRRRVERMSQMYDWLYNDLSSSQKATLRAALKRDIDNILTFKYMSKTENFVQKHSRWARGVVSEGLLAMYGDFDSSFTKSYADKELSIAREKLLKYMNVERYVAQDGGYHLGWTYTYSYTDYTFNYLTWSTATTETFLDDWMGYLSYWYIYGLRSDESLPSMGDSTNTNMSHGVLATVYNAKFKQDGYAKWYLNKNLKNSESGNEKRLFQFILGNNTEEKNPVSLPKSALFKGAGTVIARDRWDDSSTQLVFKASPFYNAIHHHRDENSFTLHYKVPLAVDSGIYDQSDSRHYKNYYTRTIAHNAVTVFNPSQKMYYNTDFNTQDSLEEKIISNDGGQIYKNSDSTDLKDIIKGGKNYLGGITNYEDNEAYTYMKGDASKAYDPRTVSLEQREIFFVRDQREHPVVIVLDRVEATDANYKKRYLLHVDSDHNLKPSLNKNIMSVITSEYRQNSNREAKLTNVTLYPQNAVTKLIGGAGKEFSVYTEENFAPLNNLATNEIYANNHRKVGNWRLEVSPPLGKKYDVMLNVLFPDDVNTPSISNSDAKLISSSTAVGVELKNRVFMFPKDKKEFKYMKYEIKSSKYIMHTIATALPCGSKIEYQINSEPKKSTVVGSGGCIEIETTKPAVVMIKKI